MPLILTERKTDSPLRTELLWLCKAARAQRVRHLAEFAESEVYLTTGRYAGQRFRCDRQPFTRLWFDAVSTGHWGRYVATGPSQSGKSLSAFVLIILWHLFDHRETVICGLPHLDLAAAKWQEDILPVIERTKYRELLPRIGSGSRGGGKLVSVAFRHGRTLRFMGGGGNDKQRAGYTARVLVVTETDGLDESGGKSREAAKLEQMEARTRAFGERARIYLECTLTTKAGRTWREYEGGTMSRIVLPCPHCGEYVTPDREHFTGWEDAEDELEAIELSALGCPSCGAVWTEEERLEANRKCVLAHRGQEVARDGTVSGPIPRTLTFGFRWTATNNLFIPIARIGAEEWKGRRAQDPEDAEKKLCQFTWAHPYEPPAVDTTPLTSDAITVRVLEDPRGRDGYRYPRGTVPKDATQLALGIDLGKRLCHWTLVAFRPGATPHVVDYSILEVPSDQLGVERALLAALRGFRDDAVTPGWPVEDSDARRLPDQVWVDAAWQTDVVYGFMRETARIQQHAKRFRPYIGRGASSTKYVEPKSTSSTVRHLGDGYHIARLSKEKLLLVEVNADRWKSWVHDRLATPPGESGAMSLFTAPPNDHFRLAQHFTAEKQVQEFVAGKGEVTRWIAERRDNHWLDSTYAACAAGHFAGARLVATQQPQRPRRRGGVRSNNFTTPDGRPFLITERR